MTDQTPAPHSLSAGLRVLAVDFARGLVMLGDVADGRGGASPTVFRYERLRLVDGVWLRDFARCERGQKVPSQVPDIADDFAWLPMHPPHNVCAKPPVIYPRRVFVSVDRLELTRALATMAKVSPDASAASLATLWVHPRGVVITSHGRVACAVSLAACDSEPAVDGLGRIVVSLAALREVVKSLSYTRAEVSIEPLHHDRGVTVAGHRLWTAHVSPVAAPPRPEDITYSSDLAAAIRRALVFASTDPDRLGMNCVALHGRPDHVLVEATDGFRAYQERVDIDGHPFGERSFTVPRIVLASLSRGKRPPPYGFAVDGDDVIVECSGVLVRCAPQEMSFPPLGFLTDIVRGETKKPGWITRTMTARQIERAREWLADTEGTVTLQIGEGKGEHAPVAVRLQVYGYDIDLAEDGDTYPAIKPPSRESTAWDLPRPFNVDYLREAFEAVDTKQPCFVTFDDGHECRRALPRYSCAQLYVHNDTRLVVTMPTRY